jgi:hypothetical protein
MGAGYFPAFAMAYTNSPSSWASSSVALVTTLIGVFSCMDCPIYGLENVPDSTIDSAGEPVSFTSSTTSTSPTMPNDMVAKTSASSASA